MGLLSTTRRHTNNTYNTSPSRIDVHEHRAPTDESLRLVQEMEDKVKAKMLASFRIETNYAKAVVICYYSNMPKNSTTFHIKFELNGREYVMVEEVDNWKWTREVQDKFCGFGVKSVFVAFHDKLSKLIALELMQQSPDFVTSLESCRNL